MDADKDTGPPPPPPQDAQDAPPPQDPGLRSIGVRRHDFTGLAEDAEAPSEAVALAPYSPFRPGLWIGHEPGPRAARSRTGRTAEGRSGLILSYDPGGLPWMTLEMRLDGDGLRSLGAAVLRIEAAANPRCAVKLVLRLPCREAETGFRDSRPQGLILDGGIARHACTVFPPMERFQPHDGFPHPVLIAFLPLRRTDLFITDLTVGPAV